MSYELPSWALVGLRTAVQAAVGSVLAWLALKGIVIDSAPVVEALTVIIIGLTAALLRFAERKFPWLSRVLSLFFSSTKPVYVEAEDVSMVAGAVDNMTTAKAA